MNLTASSQHSKRILVTIPDPSFHGGVSNIFRVLDLENQSSLVEYFYNTTVNSSANPIFFALKVCLYILRIRNKNIVHLNPSLDFKAIVRDGILLLLAKIFKKKVVVFFHGWDDNFELILRKNYFYLILFSMTFSKSDSFLLLGKVFKSKLENLKVKDIPTFYIPTIADNSYLISSIRNTNLNQKHPVRLLFMAGFVSSKGMDIVLNTMKILNDNSLGWNFELKMAGDGPELERLKTFLKENQIKNVVFPGYVSGLEKHTYLYNSDILFFPSCYGEGLPCVIMEAMLYGLVIVTRPIGAISYWVRHNKNGWLTESTDPEEFARGILELVGNPKLFKKMRENNHKIAVQNFTPNKVKDKLLKVYESVLSS